MASAKLVIAGLCVLAALIQAHPEGKRGGPGGPGGFGGPGGSGGQGGPGGPGGFGGPGGHGGPGEHGGHGGPFGQRPCMVPNASMLTQMGLDSTTAESVVKLWENYQPDANCSDIQAQEEAIIKPAMEAAMAAKAAALSTEAKSVYDQIKAVLDDTTVTDMKEKKTKIDAILNASTTTDAIKAELKTAFPFFGGHGGKHGHGDHTGTPGTTTAASA
uniref:SXP/RAL-2 family protein Ani s 5-like cation-binding domain-containing protein n=1 Tax=Plectus sambesii TaxID=2011161 RepID=A0A914V3T3_9BILA